MRFVLDEDVDAGLVGVLVKSQHQAWTIPAANLSSVDDEVVAIYGHERTATVVSHDKAFAAWRRKRCIGRHLFLHCDEMDAGELLEGQIASIVPVMERHADIFCELTVTGLTFVFAGWE